MPDLARDEATGLVVRWAHTNIGHGRDARCEVFVDLDDMYGTVDYSDYSTEDLDRWTAEEADAYLDARPSPVGRRSGGRNRLHCSDLGTHTPASPVRIPSRALSGGGGADAADYGEDYEGGVAEEG